jgi:hypothetical protein
MKKLTDKELAQIEKDDLLAKLAAERAICCALRIKNMELSQKVISLEIMDLKNKLESLRADETQAKIIRADNLKTLAKKKSLKEGWGFNPDTGEIVENE